LGDFLSSRRRARRRIRIIAAWAAGVVAAAAVAGVVILALGVNAPKAVSAETFTPSPIGKSFVPGLLVIGDSFSGGSDMGGTGKDGWPSLVQSGYTKGGARLQLNLLERGGAGYVTKGIIHETFLESYKGNAFANQDVAVVFGGLNDSDKSAAAVGAAASALYADIRKASPDVPLIVVGPAWPNNQPIPNTLEVRDAIKAAAAAAGATFIDPIADGWFAEPGLIGADHTHPTNDGHKLMAEKLSPAITAAAQHAVAANKK
jgi:lysophospholipase L1-like esterase